MSDLVSGKGVRLSINTSTTETPAWKTARHEVTVGLNMGSETEDVTTKDTSDLATAIKTAVNFSLTCTAKVSDDPGENELTFDDILTIAMQTNAHATKGIRNIKMAGTKPGEPVLEFDGFIESFDGTFAVEESGEYTFGIRVTTTPEISVVTV